MRRYPGIGQVNAVLIALYFIPLWGRDAARALSSSVYGLDDRAHLIASVFYRRSFDLSGLPQVASLLAGLKLVMATVFLAYVIDVLRGIVVGRQEDRATLDLALFLAAFGIVVFFVPVYAAGQADLVRLYATQLLMVSGAVVVSLVEREESAVAAQREALPPVVRGARPQARRGWGATLFAPRDAGRRAATD